MTLLRFVVLPASASYVQLVSKIPIALRLVTAIAAGVGIAHLLLSPIYATAAISSYRPFLLSVGAGLLVGAMLLPDTAVETP